MMMENNLQMSMNGFRTMNTITDAQWIQIQRNTFTNWVNEQLKRRNIVIDDISEDLRNGVILIALVEALSGNVIKTRVPRPQNQHEKLQNVSVALDVLSRDGVRISNIDSTDVVRGNIKLILSLIWQLVLRYQVGLSAVQHRQWFLKWLKAALPDVTITNFGRDWNDGIALYALLEFCRPGLCSNWPNINKHDRLNNCRNAMKLARQHFGIPMVLHPEDLASPDLDERSAITYLSYFIKYGGPGYVATLDRLQNRIRSKIITNFTTDWHDGEALAELVSNSGKNLPDLQDEIGLPVELIRKSINVGKYLGVEPVLTAEEITEETREHLGIMTYVSQFLPHSEYTQTINYHDVSFNRITTYENDSNFSNTTSSLTGNSLQHSQQPQSSNFHLVRHRESTAIDYPTKETTKIDIYSVGVIIDTKVHKPFDPERVRIEAVAPTGRVIKMTGDGHYSAQFMHTEIGEWKVALYYKEKYIDGCPIDICDPSQVRVVGLKAGSVGKLQEFHIDCTKGGDGEVGVDVTHNGRQIISNVTQIERGMYRVTYTPYDPGPYSIDVTFNGAEVRDSDFYTTDPEERQRKAVFYTEFENVDEQRIKVKTSCDWEIDYITGGPFVCHVTDGSDIQVYGMNDGTICSTPQLIADCSKAGNGILQAEVMYNGQKYSARITEERLNVYRITFRPTGPGIYKIWLTYDGKPVKGSPFIQEIDELEQPIASGEGLLRAMPQRTSTFIVDPRGSRGNPSVNILGPTQVVPCQIEPQSNGTFKVYYTAIEKGQYIIDVKFDHKEIEGSPYKLWVVDPSLVRVSGGWRPLMGDSGFIPLVVNKEKHIPFDASEAGYGELTAEVRGPSGHKIPVAVDARSDGRNTVIFTPRNEGKHEIDVFWGGYPLLNSPYPGWATYKPDNIEPPVRYAYIPQSPPPSIIGSVRSDAYPQVSVHGSDYDYYRTTTKHNNAVHVLPVNGVPLQPPGPIKKVPLKVVLRGKGLKEAYLNKEANFTIDATQCTEGIPDVKMSSTRTNIPIHTARVNPQVYQCTYVPRVPGEYLLYIKWNNQPLRGSPFKVIVHAPHPLPVIDVIDTDSPPAAHRVRFVHHDQEFTRVGKHVDFHIDTRDAGPGELITKVIDPHGNYVDHEVTDNNDGTRKMKFLPKMVGRYVVDILYNGKHIHGSPYFIDITASMPTGSVKVWGPGIESGILGQFHSHFWVEATGAGAGELRVKIMGPRGAFHVKMRKASKKEKLYQCFYNPIEPGEYTVNVMWSGRDIEGSPFKVLLANNKEDLERYQQMSSVIRRNSLDEVGDVLY